MPNSAIIAWYPVVLLKGSYGTLFQNHCSIILKYAECILPRIVSGIMTLKRLAQLLFLSICQHFDEIFQISFALHHQLPCILKGLIVLSKAVEISFIS